VNTTLRHGGTREEYRRINATMPSLFDYAHAAGMETVYLDAQRTAGRLHNGMNREEVLGLDHFVQYDRVPVLQRDHAIADSIALRLANDRSEFILVNKVGAHFPIHDKFPDSYMRHRPVLPRGRFADITDTGSRAGFGGSPHEWELYRNSYRNTLEWNVGAFFDRLLGKADLSRATIVYTSDHGQDLHEEGRRGLSTHCSSAPVPEEGIVPLVVIEGAAAATLDWDANLAANRDRTSHYQIFPTLLALMGFDPAEVEKMYGASLVPPSRDPGTFNILYNARLGREPVWMSIR
jgi:glucan phosphoethanolaminetransferase (alkaline phosphatase superfamily)